MSCISEVVEENARVDIVLFAEIPGWTHLGQFMTKML